MPLGNWMYPATAAELPASFRVNTKPAKTLKQPALTDAELAAMLSEWAALMSETL
jgi:ABC-type thiamine transport system substrate-binding protein